MSATTTATKAQPVFELRFEVPGRPVPAVRMTQRGAHTPDHPKRKQMDACLAFKNAVGWAAQQAGAVVWTGPVIVAINVHIRNPLKRRWDLDNVLKSCTDALNGVCYVDDKQITSASIRIYTAGRLGTDENERTVIWVAPCG